jgi:hypothetical protein
MSQTKSNKKLFRIHVTPHLKAQKHFRARVSKDDEVIGAETPVYISAGNQGISNYYTHLVVKKYEANGLYKGQFRFASSFTDAKENEQVTPIAIRYIENCPSLDEKWQDDNNFKPATAMAHVGWLLPADSIHEYDEDSTDPLFISFLKHHQSNGSNPNRDTKNAIVFIEIDSVKNVDTRKEDLKRDLARIKFIESIHEKDSLVSIYSSFLGIDRNYDITTQRDEVLKVIDELGVGKFMEQVSTWRNNYISALNGYIANGDVVVSGGKFYKGKNPDPLFKAIELKAKSTDKLIEELIGHVFSDVEVYAEFELLRNK